MDAHQALRRIEQRLVSARSIATCDAAFERYAKENLPEDAKSAQIHQGWDAGWAEAMRTIGAELTKAQTDALRGEKFLPIEGADYPDMQDDPALSSARAR